MLPRVRSSAEVDVQQGEEGQTCDCKLGQQAIASLVAADIKQLLAG